MMHLNDFKVFLTSSFGILLEQFMENDEYGFTNPIVKDFARIGYATNLTPEVIHQSANEKVELILTHHDAWDFIYGMKEECVRLLQEYGISHFYVHLPLDFASFGTCNSLLKELGISKIIQQSEYRNNSEVIGIGQYDVPITFEELVSKVSHALDEDVKAWKNSNVLISKVGVITGAGHSTELIKQAMDNDCDVYITGEKTLYSVQYAKFIGLNHIVGSHTFTEIFGIKSLAEKLKEQYNDIEIIYMEEEHLEAGAD